MTKTLRIEVDQITPELAEKAKKELRETPELVKESVEKLRQILKNDPSIHFGDDEETLMRYLRPTKFYPESAHALMKRSADFKKKYKDTVGNILPEQEKDAFTNHDVVTCLADRDAQGRRILLMKQGSTWSPSKVSGDQVFRMVYLIHLAAMLEPATQINGVVVILDFEGMGMKHVTELGPSNLLRLLSFIQDAMPLRLKEVHIINQPFIFNVVWKIIQPLLKEKLKTRLFLHGSKMADFHKHIDQEHLPKEYGGKLPAMDYTSKDWYPELLKYEDWYKANNTFGLKN